MLSNEWLLVDEDWVHHKRLRQADWLHTSKNQDEMVAYRPRTLFLDDDKVVKVQLGDWHNFDDMEVAHEANFLLSAPASLTEALGLESGEVWAYFGDAVTTTCRKKVPGIPLNELSAQSEKLVETLPNVVNACARLASEGFFHNDLRPWNLLEDCGTIRFIDFASLSRSDQDLRGLPQMVALSGVLIYLLASKWQNRVLGDFGAFHIELEELWTSHLPEHRECGSARWRTSWLSLPQHKESLIRLCEEATDVENFLSRFYSRFVEAVL